MNFVKWLKIIFGSLTGLVLLAVVTVYGVSSYRLNRAHSVPALPKLTLSNSPDVLARGATSPPASACAPNATAETWVAKS